MPTESEWEYAAKARDISLYSGGDRIDQLAWYLVNSEQRTHPVGLKGGNRSKLVDMSGNVAEWVWDRYAPYNSDDKINPKGASSGEKRGVRGGSWASAAWGTRVTFRDFKHPDTTTKQIGVRLCKTHFSQ